jgi:trimeric autotransporter adhesin
MENHMKSNTQHLTQAASSAWQRVAFVMLFLLSIVAALNGNRAYAAPPPAGTSIGNQASATYADALGNAQTPVTSNTVVTTVSQVASFTLTAAQTKTGAPGTQVYFPHTLTNTGNGTDTFDLSVTNLGGGTFDFSSVAIYADGNGDGVPDNATALTSTGALAAGGVFNFVAVGVVPGGSVSGQTDTLQVSAVGNAAAATAGGYTAAASANNVDTVTVTGNAVINVTKSMSATSGADGSGPYTVTLTYTNGGNATADTVDIGDVIPAGMTYVANSGRWSVTGATVLSDASNTDTHGTAPNTVIYDFGVSTAGKVRARINKVGPGGSGTITFTVTIAVGTAPGNINNTATYAYNDNNGTGANIGPVNTNTVAFNVLQRGAVVLDDVGSVANGIAGSLAADSNATADVVGVANAAQGATVQFDNVVHNNGNGADSFDMTLSGSTFPAGTSFQFYGSDGVTPMVDTNGNSVPDTGAVAAGGTYHVIVKAILPIGASGNNGGAGFVVTKTATSRFDPTKTDTVTDKLDAISANTVDLTNNTPRTDVTPAGTAAAVNATTTGFGLGTATVITTNATNPGTSTTFRLFLNNTSATDDNYNLSVTSALPTGWAVVFKNDGGAGNCSTTGATITNSGIVNAANSKLVCAVVTVPSTGAGAVAGTTNLTFRAQSSATGAFDTKVDAVTVNTIHNVVLTPNNVGQAFPGNFVVYTHTIANNGNVTETISFPAGTFLTDSTASWSSVLFRDNGTTPGALDATDTSVSSATTFTLAPGASATMFVKVTAPLTATVGQTDTTTVTAGYNAGASTTSATDITTVISGVLILSKEQALDAACDGTADTAFTNGTIAARPGQCVRYRITAANNGTANVTNVVISDSTPANTVYNTGAPCPASSTFGAATTVGTVATTPAVANCVAAVSVSATVGTLTPSQSAVLTFGVQVDQ